VERLRLSKDGKSLFVDWVRWDATGKIVPALYRFDLQTRELCLVGDRQKSRNWLDVDAESTEMMKPHTATFMDFCAKDRPLFPPVKPKMAALRCWKGHRLLSVLFQFIPLTALLAPIPPPLSLICRLLHGWQKK